MRSGSSSRRAATIARGAAHSAWGEWRKSLATATPAHGGCALHQPKRPAERRAGGNEEGQRRRRPHLPCEREHREVAAQHEGQEQREGGRRRDRGAHSRAASPRRERQHSDAEDSPGLQACGETDEEAGPPYLTAAGGCGGENPDQRKHRVRRVSAGAGETGDHGPKSASCKGPTWTVGLANAWLQCADRSVLPALTKRPVSPPTTHP